VFRLLTRKTVGGVGAVVIGPLSLVGAYGAWEHMPYGSQERAFALKNICEILLSLLSTLFLLLVFCDLINARNINLAP
jgi:hypothetical protein